MQTFNREGLLYLSCGEKCAEQPKRYNLWSCHKVLRLDTVSKVLLIRLDSCLLLTQLRVVIGLVCLILYVSVNIYGHFETVSTTNHTFSWASLTKRLTSNSCTYFACY